MVRSSGFGSASCNYAPFSDSLSLRLQLFKVLTSLHNATRRPVLQKVRDHACILRCVTLSLLVSIWFQVLFHSPPGVLFTFPSRYCFTIGHQVVFSLGRWSSLLPTRFHVSRGTLDQNLIILTFTYRTITSYGLTFQLCSVSHDFSLMLCPQPQR